MERFDKQQRVPQCGTGGHKEQQVKVKRIVSNIATSDLEKANTFYRDVLGLKVLMDLGWIRTYGLGSRMTIQVSVASEGGSGTPVPDMSIEVDNLEEALARVEKARIPIQYGPSSEPWGVRRFYVRDPFGKLINILQHE
jgi:catechol 2,3-dioxygenase-like lactoylglutathione lyase family enzyme